MSSLEREGLYPENYYDYTVHERHHFRSDNSTEKLDEFSSSATFRSILTVLLRIGFLLVQIGSVPVGNVNLILLQNIVDFCTVTIVYILVGSMVSFNGDTAGIVGEGIWIGNSKANINEAIVGWEATVTASAICTCGIVGRMHTVGYLITAVLISGILQPFLIHWAWTPQGWMAANYLSGRTVSFMDYAGGGIVHVVGGLSGFLGCMTLGRRILKLRDIDDSSLPADSPGSAFAGYFLIFLGLQGLSLPIPGHGTSARSSFHNVPNILINNLLAASSSSLFIVALHFALSREEFNYWTVTRCVQGAISGIVTIASGVNLYSPLVVIGISCSSGLIFYLVSRRVYRSALEDYCNVVATHLACALFGSFLAPLCARPKGIDAVNHAMVLDMAWQVICILALLLTVTLVMGPFFAVLECCGFLRNRSEFVNHLRAISALERGPPRSYMQRLFFPDVESLYLQPGSLAKSGHGPQILSPRLWRYQQEISRLEQSRTRHPGGNNLSENPQDVDIQIKTQDLSDLANQRVKKTRQIYTLRKTSPLRQFGTGGTGESLDGDSSLQKLAEQDLHDMNGTTLPRLGINEEESTHEEIDRPEEAEQFYVAETRRSREKNNFRSLERISFSGGDQNYDIRKQFCHALHRTRKFSSLHSEPRTTELEYSEDVKLSDFDVKVLLEPKRKSYASSDSEEEQKTKEVIQESFQCLDKTV